MRNPSFTLTVVLALAVGTAGAQTPASAQPTTPNPDPMAGMDMSQSKTPGESKSPDTKKGMGMMQGMHMDMSQCRCKCMGMMNMKAMDMSGSNSMDKGSPKAQDMKGMDMSGSKSGGKAMDISSGKSMDMGNGMEMMHPSVRGGALRLAFAGKSAEWTPDALSHQPHTSLTVYNEHTSACETYSGVPLIDLLKPLGVPEKPHGKDLQSYLIAEGADGYKVVYSVAEVTPNVSEAEVIVADSLNGKPLGDDGALKLIASEEKHPARWVRGVVSIKVKSAE